MSSIGIFAPDLTKIVMQANLANRIKTPFLKVGADSKATYGSGMEIDVSPMQVMSYQSGKVNIRE